MTDIFVSFRQRDAGGWAGRVYDRLAARFGPERLHHDFGDAGSDVGVAIVVIGSEWLTALDPDSGTALTDPGDEIADELATILSTGVPVVPVLVESAAMPGRDQLPAALRPLAEAMPVVVRSVRFDEDVAVLADHVERMIAAPPPVASAAPVRSASSRSALIIAALLALLGLGIAVALALATGSETGSAPVELLLRA